MYSNRQFSDDNLDDDDFIEKATESLHSDHEEVKSNYLQQFYCIEIHNLFIYYLFISDMRNNDPSQFIMYNT